MRVVIALLFLVPGMHAATPNLQFDYFWIVVHLDAPERAAV
jgi:hypothetical protein